MATAGYSGTPLLKKLGISDQMKLSLLNVPDNYYELVGADLSAQLCKKNDVPDLIHLFVTSNKEFEMHIKNLKPAFKRNSSIIIWVSWYKKVSGMATDLTEDVIREYALKNDLVDVKVCAVSDLWSGLKLVVPKNKR